MSQFPPILRTLIILAMIPLNLWSGRITPGCICADGHFEALCGHGNCCYSTKGADGSSACACSKCCRSDSNAHRSCCSENSDSSRTLGCPVPVGSRNYCHPLSIDPVVTADAVMMPVDAAHVSFYDVAPPVLVRAVVEQAIVVHLMDSGPQRDRLSLIQSLLI